VGAPQAVCGTLSETSDEASDNKSTPATAESSRQKKQDYAIKCKNISSV